MKLFNEGLYCGRCGECDNPILKTTIEEYDDLTIGVVKVGTCKKCGEFLGDTDIFSYSHTTYTPVEEIKKLLDKQIKV